MLATSAPARAQESVLLGTLGALAGGFAGTYTTTSIYVAKARTGRYIFSVEELTELRLETVPIAAGAIAGAVVGAHSGHTLAETGIWAGVGFAGGGALGWIVGGRAWNTSEGRWAGAIIGSALGMLVGGTLGAVSSWDRGGDEAVDAASIDLGVSIPLAIGGGP